MFNRIGRLINAKRVTKVAPRWLLPYAKFILGIAEDTMLFFNKSPLLSPHSINFTFKFRYFDSIKARKELGWKPKQSFEECMIKAIEFYNEQGLI